MLNDEVCRVGRRRRRRRHHHHLTDYPGSVRTMAPSQRFGAKILESMGWTEGTGLGKKRNGMVEPITVKRKRNNNGIGAVRKSPFEADPWWEKMMEEAYGAPSTSNSETDLFEACEGRRCRPHGTAKLARIERVEGGTIPDTARKNKSENELEEKDLNYYQHSVEEAGLNSDETTRKRLRKFGRLRKKLDDIEKDFGTNLKDEEKLLLRDELRKRLASVEHKLERVIKKSKRNSQLNK